MWLTIKPGTRVGATQARNITRVGLEVRVQLLQRLNGTGATSEARQSGLPGLTNWSRSATSIYR